MYVKSDTLSTRIGLHDKYSVNTYGWFNWVFDQYNFPAGAKILELGCGTAIVWRGRAEKLPGDVRIILSDYSPLMVEKARESLGGDPAFSFRQVDIQDIPYNAGFFDAVIANHMLYHVQDRERALSEIKRVLKPDGRFYATTLGKESLKELAVIYRTLEGKARFSYSEDIPFALENGPELLGRYFGSVERRDYIDALEVTDADDLIAYIKSSSTIPDSVGGELRKLVLAGFKGGVFHITKEQGIFICA
jgi:SAM-dependent methyltransferase